jgi:hypothetical protein
MSIVPPALAVAFGAFCVSLTIRVVNRRERWAKWSLAGMLGVPVLYVAGFGPACWLADRDVMPRRWTAAIYSPILTQLRVDYLLWSYGSLGCHDPFTMLHLFMLANVQCDSWQFVEERSTRR